MLKKKRTAGLPLFRWIWLVGVAAFAAPPHPLIQRALDVTGFAKKQAAGKVLHMLDSEGQELNYESSPPFLTMQMEHESWLDLTSGVERVRSKMMSPGTSPVDRGATLRNRQFVFSVQGERRLQVPASPAAQGRNLNAWTVLADWRDAAPESLHVSANERFLGYDRAVLVRSGGEYGEEKLFLDPKTGFPVKLEVVEPHYLWGQVRVEYVFQYWTRAGEAQVCVGSARLVDGFKEFTRTATTVEFVDDASAGAVAADLKWPEGGGKPMGDLTPRFLQPLPVKDGRSFGEYFPDGESRLYRGVHEGWRHRVRPRCDAGRRACEAGFGSGGEGLRQAQQVRGGGDGHGVAAHRRAAVLGGAGGGGDLASRVRGVVAASGGAEVDADAGRVGKEEVHSRRWCEVPV